MMTIGAPYQTRPELHAAHPRLDSLPDSTLDTRPRRPSNQGVRETCTSDERHDNVLIARLPTILAPFVRV
jgi:hypothetical protein